jgi:hypothetical protein
MTTETKVEEKKAGWTEAQETLIAKLQETQGISRIKAIHEIRKAEKGSTRGPAHAVVARMARSVDASLAKSKAKPAKVKAAKAERADRAEISAQKQVHIDELVNKTRGKAAVEGVYKSSLSPNFSRYIWYGMSDGRVLSVNPDAMTTRWLDASSKSAKGWVKMQARAERLAERRAEAAKKEAK